MKRLFYIVYSVLFFISIISCSKTTDNKKETSQKKENKNLKDSSSSLSKYALESANPEIISLPKDLREISGITITDDGRMFGQQDETAIVYEIDYKTGNIIKKFSLGSPPLKEDFEDIVHVNNKFYMVNSKGIIYEFIEGKDKESVDFKTYKTNLKGSNDVEGICFDPETNSLLLACKGDAGTGVTNEKAIYSFSLDKMELNSEPRFILPLSEIKKTFNPSGIKRNPKTGTFFIIAANGNEIVEISKDGKIIGSSPLPKSIHPQAEGIAFGADNTMYISNEGKTGTATIVVYPYNR